MIVANPNIGFATLAVPVGIGFILNGVALMVLGFGRLRVKRDAANPA